MAPTNDGSERVVGRGNGWGSGWRIGSRPWGALVAMTLVLAISLSAPPAFSLSLPGRRPPPSPAAAPLSQGSGRLQEVAPPPAVQQLQQALEGRRPRVEILSPADGALLPAGPWTLRLRVEDWPLVDAGPLGLGPHLVVQLDGDPPLPLTATTATMRPLEPGSHRLTVYAARPWGEVVKSPGAQRQIRLHRVAANPLSQPVPGSPQLIAVSPGGEAAATPLLLDWLLLDAPLQNLRAGDASWRLRVSINGDSFLVDQQTPLWLESWREGSNAIQLELLDGIGAPLNPPFNSLVGEVILRPGVPRPRWQGDRLEPTELASLLGEAPPPAEPAPEPVLQPAPDPSQEPATQPEQEPAPASGTEPEPLPDPEPAAQARVESLIDGGPAIGTDPSPAPSEPAGPSLPVAPPTAAAAPAAPEPLPAPGPEPARPDPVGGGSAEAQGNGPVGDGPPTGRLQRLLRRPAS